MILNGDYPLRWHILFREIQLFCILTKFLKVLGNQVPLFYTKEQVEGFGGRGVSIPLFLPLILQFVNAPWWLWYLSDRQYSVVLILLIRNFKKVKWEITRWKFEVRNSNSLMGKITRCDHRGNSKKVNIKKFELRNSNFLMGKITRCDYRGNSKKANVKTNSSYITRNLLCRNNFRVIPKLLTWPNIEWKIVFELRPCG